MDRINGVSFEEYKAFCQENKAWDLSDQHIESIWGSIAYVFHNMRIRSEIETDIAAITEIAVIELSRLLKLIDMVSSCHKDLKRWRDFGEEYRHRIASALDGALIDCLQGFHEDIKAEEYLPQNDLLGRITQELKTLPSKGELEFDETGLISMASLSLSSQQVKTAIAHLQAIDRENLTGKIVRQIFEDGFPREDGCYLIIYDILESMKCVPEEMVKRFHGPKANKEDISNYIRAFTNKDKKHPRRLK